MSDSLKIPGTGNSLAQLQAGKAKRIADELAKAGAGEAGTEALSPDKKRKITEAATQFEGLLLKQMFDAMWQTVPENELFGGGGQEQALYRDMLNEALATSASQGRGIGIRDVLVKDMERTEGRGKK